MYLNQFLQEQKYCLETKMKNIWLVEQKQWSNKAIRVKLCNQNHIKQFRETKEDKKGWEEKRENREIKMGTSTFAIFDYYNIMNYLTTYWYDEPVKLLVPFGLVSLFNGISTFMGYLMPKLSL